MDDSIGRTLAVLEELDLEKDTVIIFHADHGCAQPLALTLTLTIAALLRGLSWCLPMDDRGAGRRQPVA